MPGGDGTGPVGRGRRTGRCAGYCAGYNMPGFANPNVPRRGLGFGRGFGRGFWGRRRGFFWRYDLLPYENFPPDYQYIPVEKSNEEYANEQSYLKEISIRLEEELQKIKERLDKLSEK